MRHSVIIPHRGRELHLGLCLWGLDRSAHACGIDDWEAIVVQGGDDYPNWEVPSKVFQVVDRSHPEEFNKSRLLNLGIEAAVGETLTFLDADAIVGKRFMDAAGCLADASVDRCCYRVRYLPECEDLRIQTAEDRGAYVDELFEEYDRYRLAFEARGFYWCDVRKPPHPRSRNAAVIREAIASGQGWGNSQFSITREKLGEVRYDEYIGMGVEDSDMNMQLAARFGRDFRGTIFTDADHAMLHLEHPAGPWRDRNRISRHGRLHKRKRKLLMGG